MSLWVWLLEIVWRGLDVLLHLWQIDREMREGKWDDDADDSSRAQAQATTGDTPRTQAQATTGDAIDAVAAGDHRLVSAGHRVRAVGLGDGTLPTPPHAVRRLYQSRVQSL
jgi:hypothetical protein